MKKRKHKQRLSDSYQFPGFRPSLTVTGIFGDPKARLRKLFRRSKKRVRPTDPVFQLGEKCEKVVSSRT